MLFTEMCYKYDIDKYKYSDLYEQFLGDIRNEIESILEIGVFRGASLAMWREYLPNANIYGIDLCKPDKYKYDMSGIVIRQGDQNDEAFMVNFCRKYGSFDVIVDDGAHDHRSKRNAFIFAKQYAKKFYVIEDVPKTISNEDWFSQGLDYRWEFSNDFEYPITSVFAKEGMTERAMFFKRRI